jgi:hypothetical protein
VTRLQPSSSKSQGVKPWTPKPIWKGEDCYIIGGGPSLEGFEFDLLRRRHTIGCNVAFRLGPDICDVCVFGDKVFYYKFYDDLAKFGGPIVTNLMDLFREEGPPWLHKMRRKTRGLGTGNVLAWNSNTGALAINLALSLGATTIYLLGFDMRLQEGRSNWHTEGLTKPSADVYDRFRKGFDFLAAAMAEMYPECKVINLTEDSDLNAFPKESLHGHFERARQSVYQCSN